MKLRESLCSSLVALGTASSLLGQMSQFDVPGFGSLGDGAAVVVGNVGGTSRPDMLLLANDDGVLANQVRYRLLLDLDAIGRPTAYVPAGGWRGLPVSLGDTSEDIGAALVNLDADSRPELIVMAYDVGSPGPANRCHWFVVFNLNADGSYQSIGPVQSTVGFGNEGDGAGIAVGQIDGVGGQDIVFMAYDVGAPTNQFRYRVGFNLGSNGVPTSWSTNYFVGGVGDDADGADVTLAQIDSDPRPDLVLMAYDDPTGPNSFRVRLGMNLNAAGAATSWINRPATNVTLDGAQVAASPEGAGCAATDLDSDPRKDFAFVAYDTGGSPAAPNFFRVVWQRNWTGSSNPFGHGCGSPVPFLRVTPGVIPTQGSMLTLPLPTVPPGTQGVVVDVGAPIVPVDLTPVGLPGCLLYASATQIGLSLPLGMGTAGLALRLQGFALNPNSPAGVSLSQRCDVIIGS